MKITIWDGREFDFDELDSKDDLKTMSEDDLLDLRHSVVSAREGYSDMDDWGLVLDEVESLIDNELADRENHPHLKNDFLAEIVDNLDDWLEGKGIRIPNEERDQQDPDDGANFWGDDFDWIMEMMRDVCARNGIYVDDEWEG